LSDFLLTSLDTAHDQQLGTERRRDLSQGSIGGAHLFKDAAAVNDPEVIQTPEINSLRFRQYRSTATRSPRQVPPERNRGPQWFHMRVRAVCIAPRGGLAGCSRRTSCSTHSGRRYVTENALAQAVSDLRQGGGPFEEIQQ
jgi:hypothetical protein